MSLASLLLWFTLFQNEPPPTLPPAPPPSPEAPQFRIEGLLRQLAPELLNAGRQDGLTQDPASIEGKVVEMPSGLPLAGATVRLLGRVAADAAQMISTTRDDGTFVFRNVPPGTFTLEAERAGYISDTWGNDPLPEPELATQIGRSVQLMPGQNVTGARLQLMRGSAISGRLLDDRGDPVAGAIVQALKTTYKNGLRERTLVQSVVSNDLGEYRLFMLKPGQYHVSVALTGQTEQGPMMGSRSIPFYFPGTIDTKEAQPIEVAMGQNIAGTDVSSLPTRARRITGQVTVTDDAVGVVLSPLNGTSSMQQAVDSKDGSFEFKNVVPGSYMLVARSVNERSMTQLDVRNSDLLNLSIALGGGYRIPFRVRIEGHPPGDDPELETLYFSLRNEQSIPGVEPELYSPFPDGHFTPNLPGGNFSIDIQKPEDYYVKSMTLDGVDVLAKGLQVTRPTDTEVHVLVAKGTGNIQGHTEGGIVTVVLVPDPARRRHRSHYRSQTIAGAFRFEKVPPGDYKLFAWTEENGGPWLDSEYLRVYEDRGVAIRVEAGKTSTVSRAIPVN